MVAKPQYITDAKGRKKAVILPIRAYLRLLEDIHDLAVVARRRDEATISLEEVERRSRPMASYTVCRALLAVALQEKLKA